MMGHIITPPDHPTTYQYWCLFISSQYQYPYYYLWWLLCVTSRYQYPLCSCYFINIWISPVEINTHDTILLHWYVLTISRHHYPPNHSIPLMFGHYYYLSISTPTLLVFIILIQVLVLSIADVNTHSTIPLYWCFCTTSRYQYPPYYWYLFLLIMLMLVCYLSASKPILLYCNINTILIFDHHQLISAPIPLLILLIVLMLVCHQPTSIPTLPMLVLFIDRFLFTSRYQYPPNHYI